MGVSKPSAVGLAPSAPPGRLDRGAGPIPAESGSEILRGVQSATSTRFGGHPGPRDSPGPGPRPSAGDAALDASTLLPMLWAQAAPFALDPDPDGVGTPGSTLILAFRRWCGSLTLSPPEPATGPISAGLWAWLAGPGGAPGGGRGLPGAGPGDRPVARRPGPCPAARRGDRPGPAVGAAAGAGRRGLGGRLDRQPDVLLQRRRPAGTTSSC